MQKFGVFLVDLLVFFNFCWGEFDLQIEGLMCILLVEELVGLYFVLLVKLVCENGLNCLFMGMSLDYEIVVQLGVSLVCVGMVLFGVCDQLIMM